MLRRLSRADGANPCVHGELARDYLSLRARLDALSSTTDAVAQCAVHEARLQLDPVGSRPRHRRAAGRVGRLALDARVGLHVGVAAAAPRRGVPDQHRAGRGRRRPGAQRRAAAAGRAHADARRPARQAAPGADRDRPGVGPLPRPEHPRAGVRRRGRARGADGDPHGAPRDQRVSRRPPRRADPRPQQPARHGALHEPDRLSRARPRHGGGHLDADRHRGVGVLPGRRHGRPLPAPAARLVARHADGGGLRACDARA